LIESSDLSSFANADEPPILFLGHTKCLVSCL
jgi:hypothetical protein